MKLNGNAEAVYEKIAKLRLDDVSDEQIASVVGCSLAEIEEIVELEGYQKVFGEIFGEIAEGHQVRNKGWDEVESLALSHVMKAMDGPYQDPELALKVAAVANKAHRRHVGNKPIAAADGPISTTVVLQSNYIQYLQKFEPGERPARIVDAKEQSFLDVEKVKGMLGFEPGKDDLVTGK